MLEAMRKLALDYLVVELYEKTASELGMDDTIEYPDDVEEWFHRLREKKPQELFKYLLEDSPKITHGYIISPDPNDPELAHLRPEELDKEKKSFFPFIKKTGSQSPDYGPVIKRTIKNNPSPSSNILKRTLKSFQAIADENKPWSDYFARIVELSERKKLLFKEILYIRGDGTEEEDSLLEEDMTEELSKFSVERVKANSLWEIAVNIIPEKKTCFLTMEVEMPVKEGEEVQYRKVLPGQEPTYIQYLQEILSEKKYTTNKAPVRTESQCSLCARKTDIYPNGVKGAGLNFANVDREGSFFGLTTKNAWKSYSVCLDCADLLFIYKSYVAKQFTANIAGEKALIIPETNLNNFNRREWYESLKDYLKGMEKGVDKRERDLLEILKEHHSVMNISILWAEQGQLIENVRGFLSDILPSRLGEISKLNSEANKWESPIFPKDNIEELEFSLNLACLKPLFKFQEAKKKEDREKEKKSTRFFAFKHDIIASIYHKKELHPARFWQEVFLITQFYFTQAQKRYRSQKNKEKNDFLYPYPRKKKDGSSYLTLASLIRHLARFIHYLRFLEVFPMADEIYKPESELLKPYFSKESGIDSKERAFAFILGVLFGKLMQVQGAKGVNVLSNSIPWLKHLTLKGRDLPELYNKIREKLIVYETEKNPQVREIIHEASLLGTKLGMNIHLDTTQTCYFLLLGQSLAADILAKKKAQENL